jgi:hypothetical protein
MFIQIADYQGVVAGVGVKKPWIVVPRGRCNLVVHDQGPYPNKDVGPGIDFYDLTPYLGRGAAGALGYLQSQVKAPLDTWTPSAQTKLIEPKGGSLRPIPVS